MPRSLSNLVLRLRYRFDVDANNSGIQIRSRLLPEVSLWTIAGYQYDIGCYPLDDYYKTLEPEASAVKAIKQQA